MIQLVGYIGDCAEIGAILVMLYIMYRAFKEPSEWGKE